jgi:hypothetical protein
LTRAQAHTSSTEGSLTASLPGRQLQLAKIFLVFFANFIVSPIQLYLSAKRFLLSRARSHLGYAGLLIITKTVIKLFVLPMCFSIYSDSRHSANLESADCCTAVLFNILFASPVQIYLTGASKGVCAHAKGCAEFAEVGTRRTSLKA